MFWITLASALSLQITHQLCTSPGKDAYLPIPEVAATLSLEDKDIIGIEGGGPGRHLKGLGVELVGPMHLEKADGGHWSCAASSGGTTLGVRGRGKKNLDSYESLGITPGF